MSTRSAAASIGVSPADNTDLALAQTIGQQYTSLAQLYRALGGVWKVPPPAVTPTGK
jgi:hypothetical protein